MTHQARSTGLGHDPPAPADRDGYFRTGRGLDEASSGFTQGKCSLQGTGFATPLVRYIASHGKSYTLCPKITAAPHAYEHDVMPYEDPHPPTHTASSPDTNLQVPLAFRSMIYLRTLLSSHGSLSPNKFAAQKATQTVDAHKIAAHTPSPDPDTHVPEPEPRPQLPRPPAKPPRTTEKSGPCAQHQARVSHVRACFS
jgi:hypothetical protein